MGKKIYLVALIDVKSDSVIEETLQAFSSRDKQIQRVNELKDTFGYVSGVHCIFTKTLQLF